MPLDDQTRAWLRALHAGGTYSYWWTLEKHQSFWWEVGRWTPLPGGTRNVYVGVHPVAEIPTTNARGEAREPSQLRSHNTIVSAVNCLFAEFDAKDTRYGSKEAVQEHIDQLEPRPSVVIDSGGGFHAYWFLQDTWCLDTPEERQQARAIQRAWVLLVGGDDVKDLARVLRVPGTYNHKYKPPRPVRFVCCDLSARYQRDDLISMCRHLVPATGLGNSANSANSANAPENAQTVVARWIGNAVARVCAAPDGQKHATLLRAASALAGLVPLGVLTEREIESSLFAAVEGRAEDAAQARKTIQDGIAYGKDNPWPADVLTRDGRRIDRAIQDEQKQSQTTEPEAWQPPMSFQHANLPPFPLDIFPTWLRDFCEAITTTMQTPPDLSGMLALSILSAATARLFMVTIRPGWDEPINVYTVTSLPPGSRKSPVFRAMNAPLVAFEHDLITHAQNTILKLTTERDIVQQQLDGAKRDAAKKQTNEAYQQVDDLLETLKTIEVPAIPKLVVDDITPEALSTALVEQGGRIAALSAEGDLFAIMAGRYSSGMPNLGVFLKSHAGDPIRIDRRSRSEVIHNPCLTVGITTQPDVLRSFSANAAFRGQGLLARFFYALPKSTVGSRAIETPPIPEPVRVAYHAAVHRLLVLARCWHSGNIGNSGKLPPVEFWDLGKDSLISINYDFNYLLINKEGNTHILEFQAWLEPQLGERGALEHVSDWASKLTGGAVRVAGLLHLASLASQNSHNSQNSDVRIIPAEIVRQALAFTSYLIAHAQAAYAEIGTNPAAEPARIVLRWLDKTGLSIFTKRDAWQGTRGGVITKADDLDPALEFLLEHGYIREAQSDERTTAGRKPSTRYEVNPYLASQNSHNSQNSAQTVETPRFEAPPTSQNSQNSQNGTNGHHSDPITPLSANGLIERLRARQQGSENDAA